MDQDVVISAALPRSPVTHVIGPGRTGCPRCRGDRTVLSLGHLGVGRWWLSVRDKVFEVLAADRRYRTRFPLIHPVTALPQAQRATGIAAFVHVAVLRPSR